MLQIIGWMLCLFLVLKACEINANPAYQEKDAEGKTTGLNGPASAAAAFALIGAVIFAGLLYYQGQAVTDAFSSSSSYGYSVDDATAAADDAAAAGDAAGAR